MNNIDNRQKFFSARMYGLHQSTRKTEKIIEVLNQKDDNA